MIEIETPRQVIATATADATLTAGKHTPVDATSGNRTMALPSSANPGAHLSVEKVDATANTVTVSGNIRGITTTYVLTAQYESVTLVVGTNGTSWWPTSAGQPGASLSARYAPKASAVFTGTTTVDALTARTAALGTGAVGGPRMPVDHSSTIDGSLLSATNPSDKVGMQNTVVFKGGFAGEGGFGASNPDFVWGMDIFTTTGSTAGDVAGLTNITALETEVHLYTPSASVDRLKGLQVDAAVESSATSATVDTLLGIYVTAIAKNAPTATVTHAYGLFVEAPTAGSTTNEAIHAEGNASVAGTLTAGLFDAGHTGVGLTVQNISNSTTSDLEIYAGYADADGAHLRLEKAGSGGHAIAFLDTGGSFLFVHDGSNVKQALGRDGTLGVGAYPDLGGGTGPGIYLANISTVPTANPSGGGIIYVESGALKYRGTSGTVTILGPA